MNLRLNNFHNVKVMTIRLKKKFASTTEDRDFCTDSDVTMANEF